jgi:hypothetical protein
VTAAIPVTEGEVLNGILGLLRAYGFLVWRQNTGMAMLKGRGGKDQPVRFGFPGLPDILGTLPGGRSLYIEVKKPGGKVRPAQVAFIDSAVRAGALAFVAYSMDEVYDRLKKEGYIK